MSYPLFGPPCVATGLGEVRASCVENFPTSENRPMIMEGVENTARDLTAYSAGAKMYIGGAFVCGETEPDRADVLVHSPPPATGEDAILLQRISGEQDVEQGCHIYALPEIPEDHPKRTWWLRQWELAHNTVTDDGRLGCAIVNLK